MPVAKLAAIVRLPLLLALAALTMAVALASSGAYAAGGAISVVDMQEQVNFPNGVGLTVTAESDTDIVEVRVFFRASGSSTWGYAYADFEPGSRVVATRSIPASETAYLAPGVDVEYYYFIKDAHGSVLETERTKVEYLDGRYDWRRVLIGPLELIYHDIGDGQVADATRQLEQDLQRVTNLLQLNPKDSFKGVVYNSYRDANAIFPKQSQTTTDHGTFAGYAFPEQGVFVGQGLDRRIIVHESTHLLFREAVGDGAIDVPAWLDEGFATYVEPKVRIRGSGDLEGRTLPLRAMNSVSGTPKTIPLFYYKSVSVVAFLIEKYGKESFRLLLDQLAASRSIEDALLNVYGFDVDGLDARWAGRPVAPAATPVGPPLAASSQESVSPRAENDAPQPDQPSDASQTDTTFSPTPVPPQPFPARQGQGESPSPFLYFDIWILAGVSILVALVLGSRFAYSRVRDARRPNDASGTEWLDSDWENE